MDLCHLRDLFDNPNIDCDKAYKEFLRIADLEEFDWLSYRYLSDVERKGITSPPPKIKIEPATALTILTPIIMTFLENERYVAEKTYKGFFKKGIEAEFNYFMSLSTTEEKTRYVEDMCIYYLVATSNKHLDDYPEEVELKLRADAYRQTHFRAKKRLIYQSKKELKLIKHGTRLASRISEDIVKGVARKCNPERCLHPKTMEAIRVGIVDGGLENAYLFPLVHDDDDIMWISYEYEHNGVKGGFGSKILGVYTGFSLPCWGEPNRYYYSGEVDSQEELETLISTFCDLLRTVYPYHKQFLASLKNNSL